MQHLFHIVIVLVLGTVISGNVIKNDTLPDGNESVYGTSHVAITGIGTTIDLSNGDVPLNAKKRETLISLISLPFRITVKCLDTNNTLSGLTIGGETTTEQMSELQEFVFNVDKCGPSLSFSNYQFTTNGGQDQEDIRANFFRNRPPFFSNYVSRYNYEFCTCDSDCMEEEICRNGQCIE